MKAERSASQILYGLLPEQTADIDGGVWKVKEWRSPRIETRIDTDGLKRELRRLAYAYHVVGNDSGFVENLDKGADVRVLCLDKENGVYAEPFPEIWICRSCKRIHKAPDTACQCGHKGKKGQLAFVGYHECGRIKQPFIRRCPQHNQVKIVLPGTSSATEIRFFCPVCEKQIQKGFGGVSCECGRGNLHFTVHRASTVYTPRTVVLVNAPSRQKIRKISDAGGRARALDWVVGGMEEKSVIDVPATLESLRRQLQDQGLPEVAIDQMLATAEASGALRKGSTYGEQIADAIKQDAEDQALTIAMATLESRKTVADLQAATPPSEALGPTYHVGYPSAMAQTGFSAVELIDRFPVLTGQFGYVRGAGKQEAVLRPFKEKKGNAYVVYGDLIETEALFFKLNPRKVACWLKHRGFVEIEEQSDDAIRLAILKHARPPRPGEQADMGTLGAQLLTLIHSLAHRMIRTLAVYSGIDRNALSELIVPLHLGFFVYAAARGDFVLGGLQAVFDSELDRLLREFLGGEHRCALDPGCSKSGSACVACLHLGEPSCRYFNTYLSRDTMFGDGGYLA